MGKNNAITMIFIVLLLLLVSASPALAVSITNVKAYGDDNLPPFMKAGDTLTIEASVIVDEGTEVQPGDVEINSDGGSQGMSSCIDGGTLPNGKMYNCSYSLSNTNLQDNNYHWSFYIKYGDVHSNSYTVLEDDSPPNITILSIQQKKDNITIRYRLRDNNSYNNECPGIDRLEIKDGNTPQIVLTDSINTDHCDYTGKDSVILGQGEHELRLSAYDRLGNHRTTEPFTVWVDLVDPIIAPTASAYHNGEKLNFIPPLGPSSEIDNVTINLTVSDDSNITAYGDLSSLVSGNVMKNKYKKIDAECTGEGEDKTCLWKNITLNPPSGSDKKIRVNATDSAGNSVAGEAAVDIEVDDEQPELNSLGTSRCFDGQCYLKKNDNTIIANINEGKSGLHKNNIFLNLKSLNNGPRYDRKRMNCTKSSDSSWVCNATVSLGNAVYSGNKLPFSILRSSSDDVGNRIKGELITSAIADIRKPNFINITVKPEEHPERGVVLPDDNIVIDAFINETDTGIRKEDAFINASAFYDGRGLIGADRCSREDKYWHCIWHYDTRDDSNPLDPSGKNLKLEAIVTDYAGNRKRSRDDNVYGQIYISYYSSTGGVNWWKDSIKVNKDTNPPGKIPTINRNLLWMGGGAYIRLTMTIETRGNSHPYLHEFNIDECKEKVKDQEYDVTVAQQGYINPSKKKTKWVVLSLPSINRNILNDSSLKKIKMNCTAYIVQGSSLRSPVIGENEKAEALFDIPLSPVVGWIFKNPGEMSYFKIERNKKKYNFYNRTQSTLATVINLTSILCEYTGGVEAIMGHVGAMGHHLVMIPYLEAVGQFMINSFNSFDRTIWRAHPKKSTHLSWISLYNICQSVECNGCSGKTWLGKTVNNFPGRISSALGFNGFLDKITESGVADRKSLYEGLGDNRYATDFFSQIDPKNSIVASILCKPPCMTGIYNFLYKKKMLLEFYNACYRYAISSGSDTSRCDMLKSRENCLLFGGELSSLLIQPTAKYISHVLLARTIAHYTYRWALSQVSWVAHSALAIYEGVGALQGVKRIANKIIGGGKPSNKHIDDKNIEKDFNDASLCEPFGGNC